MTAPLLKDETGKPLALAEVLGEGGEGRVYELANDPSRAVKHYFQSPSDSQVEKIRWMATQARESLTEVTAWPLGLVSDQGNRPVGYLMPRISRFQALDRLSNPAKRYQHFPNASWAFQLRVARNLTAVVARLHRAGCVCGDLNPSNILVDDDADVRIIDCDSFFINAGNRQYFCPVGQGEFLAPELHGQRLDQQPRQPGQDAFALMVMVFQLLFLGRHPFAGKPLSSDGSETDPMENIRQGRFIFSPEAAKRGIAPPPRIPPFEILTAELRHFTIQALDGSPLKRPVLDNLFQALVQTETMLRLCEDNDGHDYLAHLQDCPWCKIDARRKRPIYPAPGPLLENLVALNLLSEAEQRQTRLDDAIRANLPLKRAPRPTLRTDTLPENEAKRRGRIKEAVNVNLPPHRPLPPQVAGPVQRSIQLAPLRYNEDIARKLYAEIKRITPPHAALYGPIVDVELKGDPVDLAQQFDLPLRGDRIRYQQKARTIAGQLNRLRRGWQTDLWNLHHNQQLGFRLLQRLLAIPQELDDKVKRLQTLSARQLNQEHLERCLLKDVLPGPLNRSGLLSLLESYEVATVADLTLDNLDAIPGLGNQRKTTLQNWYRHYTTNLNQHSLAQQEASVHHRELQQEINDIINRLQRLPVQMHKIKQRFQRISESQQRECRQALNRLTLLRWLARRAGHREDVMGGPLDDGNRSRRR